MPAVPETRAEKNAKKLEALTKTQIETYERAYAAWRQVELDLLGDKNNRKQSHIAKVLNRPQRMDDLDFEMDIRTLPEAAQKKLIDARKEMQKQKETLQLQAENQARGLLSDQLPALVEKRLLDVDAITAFSLKNLGEQNGQGVSAEGIEREQKAVRKEMEKSVTEKVRAELVTEAVDEVVRRTEARVNRKNDAAQEQAINLMTKAFSKELAQLDTLAKRVKSHGEQRAETENDAYTKDLLAHDTEKQKILEMVRKELKKQGYPPQRAEDLIKTMDKQINGKLQNTEATTPDFQQRMLE
ncbi:MAG: hypothetical protein EBV03_10685, partial [Proteobacteria bacterium]|nr:hypothetical protein [Pseudomonadota bacterium]